LAFCPGKENVKVDKASRVLNDETEWQLDRKIFKRICKVFGKPEIDFASRLNRQVKTYCAWHPDPQAWHIDAFTLNWQTSKFYAFPPFSILPMVLQKLIQDKAQGILVVTYWTSQPWMALLAKTLVEPPRLLNISKNVLRLPHNPGRTHPLVGQLRLLVCKCAGSLAPARATAAGSYEPCRAQSEIPHISNILRISPGGSLFVKNGDMIVIIPL